MHSLTKEIEVTLQDACCSIINIQEHISIRGENEVLLYLPRLLIFGKLKNSTIFTTTENA